jgi:tripeptide aminopeptidase
VPRHPTALAVVLLAASTAVAQPPDAAVKQILASPAYAKASAFLDGDHARFVRELIALTEIPAPPFKEAQRARAYLEHLRQLGLSDVEMDGAGNVMGVRAGAGNGPMVAILAHLDTVFPEGTDVTVKREGNRLMAPGVGDDTRGLALMLQVIRALDAGGFGTGADLLFVGNVGEEGEGDLRGTKFLLKTGKYKDRIAQLIAIDGGAQDAITTGGVGSRRYRVTFSGPGGHSYGAFGLVNPAFAMGKAIARFSALQVPSRPKTTFNVGVVTGGTSINSIPAAVSMDIDMRSESCAELRKVDAAFLALVKAAVADENAARSTREGPIVADPALIGDRPCGATAPSTPLVQHAAAVVRAFGMEPSYRISSTDANVPMSLGMPAITIGRGGRDGRGHSPDEWTEVEPASAKQAAQVAMAIILAAAGAR